MRVFMSSIGRRISLVNIFKEVFTDLYIVGGDYLKTAPALKVVDKAYKLPYKIDEEYVNKVLEICKKECIDLVIPLIDTELEVYSRNKELFAENGITLMVSDYKAMKISLDKLETFNYYKSNKKIIVPITSLLNNYRCEDFKSDKIVLKPKNGSSGNGIYIIQKSKVVDLAELLSLDMGKYIAQEYVDFDTEVTIDMFVYKNKVIELCQRKRLKVRGGEVEQAITIKDENITKIVQSMIEELNFFGIINIQIMIKDNKYYLGEINTRFGGGFPLSYYSGANLLEHLEVLILNTKFNTYLTNRYEENFCMLRYDDAIFIKEEDLDARFE